jgi:signal peptidase I
MMGMDQQQAQDEYLQEENKSNETWEWIKALGIAVIIAVAIRVFLFAPIVVDGESMMPTLEDRERLIVNKIIYMLDIPERGDIVVFHATESKDWIKRVIGEPGDIVEVRDDTLFINNKEVKEPYLDASKLVAAEDLTKNFYEKVPDGHVFVMGDNRPNSRDSRSIGPIPISSIVGRADIVFWPMKELRLMHNK